MGYRLKSSDRVSLPGGRTTSAHRGLAAAPQSQQLKTKGSKEMPPHCVGTPGPGERGAGPMGDAQAEGTRDV